MTRSLTLFAVLLVMTACGKNEPHSPVSAGPAAKQVTGSDVSIRNLSVRSTTPGELSTSWDTPERNDVRDYRVMLAKSSENYIPWNEPGGLITTTSTSKSYSGLEEGVNYKFAGLDIEDRLALGPRDQQP